MARNYHHMLYLLPSTSFLLSATGQRILKPICLHNDAVYDFCFHSTFLSEQAQPQLVAISLGLKGVRSENLVLRSGRPCKTP
jgi:hypothetical protein